MPLKAHYVSEAGALRLDLSEPEMRAAFESGEGTLWVDVYDTTPEDGELLSTMFGFHPLAIEDCVDPAFHPAKVEDFPDYVFAVVHGINYAVESSLVETAQLCTFIGRRYVVTCHQVPLSSLDAVAHSVEMGGRPMEHGAGRLAHAIISALIDNVQPTLERMSEVAGEVEEESIRGPQQHTIEVILALKRSTLRLQRVLAPQRDIMNRLGRGDFPVVGTEAYPFFRDVYDAVVRLGDGNHIVRERADNALTTYMTSVSLRQNETMKALAIVASIFMPLTLLAGIYGMNFQNMPELGWRWAYFAVLGFMGAIGAGAMWWFWARRWITIVRVRRLPRRTFAVMPHRLRRRPPPAREPTPPRP